MPNILLQIDASMARRLERVAPAKTRERSRFIRLAIEQALMARLDLETRKSYAAKPDAPALVDARAWGEWKSGRVPRRKR